MTPALIEDVIEQCRHAFEAGNEQEPSAAATILANLTAIHDHLVRLEQRDLGEWISDIPTNKIGDFLADMEVTARQADAESDIGAFISALADWQTTAEACRNNW